ncbi:MAG: DUF115 domain-containing protein [Sphingomonadales bacterium]|nr:DUF115 domain-containing protein [Sphingomonadaceae bacterium]MBS3930441.1 DUF115 domain-containing protein [Sphingomonadales bacterium]
MSEVAAEVNKDEEIERGLERMHAMGVEVKTLKHPLIVDRNWEAEQEMQGWVGPYMRNIAWHYHDILAAGHIGPLLNRLGGRPVAVVGAGASLDKNVDSLRDFPGIIIACDRAAKALTARDICPDIVVAVDPRPYHIAKMLDYPQSKGQTLVASVCLHPDVVQAWRGRVRYMSHENPGTQFFDHGLPHLFPGMPALYCLGNVGNMAVQLAAEMGAGKIVLVGQDYGYTDGKMSADDWVYQHQSMFLESGWRREVPDHAYNLERRTGKVMTKGIDGEVQTYAPFLGYRDSLYNIVKLWNLDVVNATEGGILVDLPQMALSKVVTSLLQFNAGEARTLLSQALGG